MKDETLHNYSLLTLLILSPLTYILLKFITAPYGRHHRTGWGPTVPPWLAWLLMESPTIFLSLIIFPLGNNATKLTSISLYLTFILHYFHRTFIYPFRLRKSPSTVVPVSVALMGFSFNLLNAYVQARSISHYSNYTSDLFFWSRFWFGLFIFICGMLINVKSDLVLLGLKAQQGGDGYKIPKGGLFEFVSCPNYFGEIVEWFGWGLMTWSCSGFAFFLYTCSNLLPRGFAHHVWYLNKFREDYPKNRKAVIPYLY